MSAAQSARAASAPGRSNGTARRVAIVGGPTKGNRVLWKRLRGLGYAASLLDPPGAAAELRAGDVAFDRVDVLPTLDGVAPGLDDVELLVERGVRVVNPPAMLLSAHDKLATCRLLLAAAVTQPAFTHVTTTRELEAATLPCVVKPRFGSWGVDVFRCRTLAELEQVAGTIADRSWFHRHGALVQELMPTPGRDLRVLVAAGRVVGAARRIAAPGEWRTNVTLGGSLERLDDLADDAATLSRAAANALGADFIGIDLLEVDGSFVVIELNGAPEFDEHYSVDETDVFVELAAALDLPLPGTPAEGEPEAATA
jgi:RimK family alpha-L-glutamate ligase